MDDNDFEKVCSLVHDAWWEEKKSQGYHSPCEKQGSCDKCHVDMVPYENLPESTKDYDRKTVQTVLKAVGNLSIGEGN